MTSGIVGVTELREVDEQVADWIANLHATIEVQSEQDMEADPKGLRGLMVGRLTGVLGDDDKRHVFLETVTGKLGGSSMEMGLAEVRAVMWFIDENEGAGLTLVPRMVEAILKAKGQMELPLGQDPVEDPVVKDAVENLGAKVKSGPQPASDSPDEEEPTLKEPTVFANLVNQYVDERRAGLLFQEAEAPASINFFGVSRAGWNIQFTLRDGSEGRLLTRLGAMMSGLEDLKIFPCNRYGDRIVTTSTPKPPANGGNGSTPPTGKPPGGPPTSKPPTSKPPTAGPPPQKPATAPPTNGGNGNGGEQLEFAAEALIAQLTTNGNRQYRVKGSRWRKFGVICWPEVAEKCLEALTGWNPIQLDIGQDWNLKDYGITAVCVKAADKNSPSKVVDLVKK